ncbi:hypothetical protein [Qipengyuania nanhaisediminis]|uniref:hypothetical protein n=1 Tax=Qipengyuania nanhaisediminis TaxID=604088 RepID=UPI0038B3E17C
MALQPNLSIGDWLKAEPYKVRRRVLEVMDELSRPMTRAEIEEALRPSGMTRSERRRIAKMLKHLPIIAIGLDKARHKPPRTTF